MTQRYNLRTVGLMAILGVAALAGCKKHVAASPPATTPPTAPPAAAAPTITLRAEPSSINRGQGTALRWETRNATNVKIAPGLGDVSTNGTRSSNPTSSVTYMATATGPDGTASDSTRITVNIPPAPPARPEPPRTPNVSIDQLFQQNVRTIYFDYDKSDIRPDQMAPLQNNATWLKQHPEVKFTIEGNCDERGSEEHNLALGDRRANKIKDFVGHGIPESRITTISYGEGRPVCRESAEACYQRNSNGTSVPKPTS
jgi:peptidoglycan-associated lipoprotein